nr:membrane-bound monodehydroascorbate reductase [Nephromyces sp. MMRI]AZL94763.1 membrane-bound monodehydroascorbate reductase [Nephromyces sp. MMRI]
MIKNDKVEIIRDEELDEIELGDIQQFKEGEMYQIKILGGKESVLLSLQNGNFFCVGNSCAHYGAPMHKGVLGSGYVTCSYHNAQFDLTTGKALNGPSMDGLPKFETKQKDGKLYAILPKTLPLNIEPTFIKRDPQDNRVFIIIGSGPGGYSAAETLRQEGYTGKIILISDESFPPYNRPALSKNLKVKVDNILLREEKFFNDKLELEFMKNTKVESVEPVTHTVKLASGSILKYDKVLIATGSTPNQLNVPGSNLNNIFVLRNIEDNNSIQNFSKEGARVVIIGSSFIGMELASAMNKLGVKVTIISNSKTPFESSLGSRIGNALKNLFEQKGVEFFLNSKIKCFRGKSGNVNGVELDNGEVIQADAVIYGIGVTPNTSILKNITKRSDGSLEVDPFMKVVNSQDVFVAGDIASFPYFKTGELIRSEHWNSAMNQGRIAAKNMMNKFVPYSEIPFFWSSFFGKSIRFSGFAKEYDDICYEGEVDKLNFIAYFTKNQKVIAVAYMGMDNFTSIASEAIKSNLMPTLSELQLSLANSKSITEKVKNHINKVDIQKIN